MSADPDTMATAERLQRDASALGFDWPDIHGVWDKLHEEVDELRQAAASGDVQACTDELGDVLFALVNLARHLDVSPAAALDGTNAKFRRRFAAVQQAMTDAGVAPGRATLAQMDAAWDAAKRTEASGTRPRVPMEDNNNRTRSPDAPGRTRRQGGRRSQ